MDLIKEKGIDVEIKWTPGHAEIKGNEEADRLAKEASKEAELMSDEGTCISQPELKQATKTHGLTVWQRQWDISDKVLKSQVTTKTLFDFQNRKLYSQIAQLRIGYAKLNDYMQKIGISETRRK